MDCALIQTLAQQLSHIYYLFLKLDDLGGLLKSGTFSNLICFQCFIKISPVVSETFVYKTDKVDQYLLAELKNKTK